MDCNLKLSPLQIPMRYVWGHLHASRPRHASRNLTLIFSSGAWLSLLAEGRCLWEWSSCKVLINDPRPCRRSLWSPRLQGDMGQCSTSAILIKQDRCRSQVCMWSRWCWWWRWWWPWWWWGGGGGEIRGGWNPVGKGSDWDVRQEVAVMMLLDG